MKQLRYRLLIMLAALMLLPTGVGAAEAQKDLKIQDVFTRYGKKRNVTMVELSNEMLETYGMTRYKSITIKDDPEALRFTRQCLEADQRNWANRLFIRIRPSQYFHIQREPERNPVPVQHPECHKRFSDHIQHSNVGRPDTDTQTGRSIHQRIIREKNIRSRKLYRKNTLFQSCRQRHVCHPLFHNQRRYQGFFGWDTGKE